MMIGTGWRRGWLAAAGLSVWAGIAVPATAQNIAFETVVKDLQNPDAKARLNAIRVLRQTAFPEAAGPIAGLVTDPVDEVQLEAIDAELALFLTEPISTRRRVALVVEVRGANRARAAFDAGPAALVPRPIPPQLVTGLIAAALDDNARVREDALYALGTFARPSGQPAGLERLVEGLTHPDPGVRAATARVIGRLQVKAAGEELIYAMNDPLEDVRVAAMQALGDLRDGRALQALGAQFAFYERGEAAEVALSALARIAHAGTLPVFDGALRQKDAGLRRFAAEGIGRLGRAESAGLLESALAVESSKPARVAIGFALHKVGRAGLPHVVDGLADSRTEDQARAYLLELGPPIAPALVAYLRDTRSAVREAVADVLGLIADGAAVRQLDPMRADPDARVAAAANRAIQRIQLRQGPQS